MKRKLNSQSDQFKKKNHFPVSKFSSSKYSRKGHSLSSAQLNFQEIMPAVVAAAQNAYKLEKEICKTYFGRVHVAKNLENGGQVVCKISNRTLVANSRPGTIEDPAKEVDFLSKLQCIREQDSSSGSENFINLIESFQDATHDWTVLEYAQQGDLFEMVQRGALKNNQAKLYFRQLVEGVHYLHKHQIVHRDLSLENFFVSNDNGGTIKIGDFGQARLVDVDDEGKVKELMQCKRERPGKPGYMAPEIHEGVSYDAKAADVFALGVSLFVLSAGIPPFARADHHDRCFKFVKQGNLHKLVSAWKLNIDAQAVELIQGMLNAESHRFSLEQVLAHPFLDQDVSMTG